MSMKRRKFLELGTASTTAMFLSSFQSLATAETPAFSKNENCKLKILATSWGFDGTTDAFLKKAKAAGYDGTEMWCPADEQGKIELINALKKYEMELGLLCGSGNKDPKKNYEEFEKMLINSIALKPIYINCHTAKDYFSFDQLKPFFELTFQLSKQSGIPIYHETHRSRALYSAPVTKSIMDKLPALRITFDVSHWCNVHESLLADQADTIKEVLQHVDHIHARIGHAEGPQVNDPRAPEWEEAVKAHLSWWDVVVERKKKNAEQLTILTEFGPPDYMPTLPYTRQPLADQWAINVFMLQLLRKRYS